jgi:hypothetical protein
MRTLTDRLIFISTVAIAVGTFVTRPAAVNADEVAFKLHRVGTYRSEACGVGDFNGDGKLDIVAGPLLYLGPDFGPVKIRELSGEVDEDGSGYMYDFMNLPLDVDGDGRLDVVSCSWHEKRSVWFRNIGVEDGKLWPENVIEVNGPFEHGELWDIDGDGVADEILPGVKHTSWYEIGKQADGKQGVLIHIVSQDTRIWGVGAGDVNGDGRIDILRPGAWFEAPADLRAGDWKPHPLVLGSLDGDEPDHTPQILVHDVDGDGLNDIITSSAHKYGIFWYRQISKGQGGEPKFEQRVIDKSWSQAHSLTLADMDGDGDKDLVTGKRFRAHNGKDPGGLDPPGVYWYELTPGRTVTWKRHVISLGDGVGSGMNIPVVDLDGDGDLDVVVTGKFGGPVWFENLRK